MPYGSIGGVEAYTRHMTFDGKRSPTTDQITAWLAARSAILNGWLAAAGYTIPVVQADAVLILDRYASVGAAGDAELAQRSAGYNKEEQNKRENKFLAEFDKAEAFINSGALIGLGVPHSDASEAAGGLSFVPATYGVDAVMDEYSRPLEYMP
jgi:hypothetical protein